MTIYQVLKQDHEQLKSLLTDLVGVHDETSDRSNVKELIAEVRDCLVPHSRAEENVFYNSLRTIQQTKELGFHGFMEHAEAEALLRTLQLQSMVMSDFHRTAHKLQDALLHHIEEEESLMFSAAQSLFTKEESEAMVEPFVALKSKVKNEGFLKTTWDMAVNLMPQRSSSPT